VAQKVPLSSMKAGKEFREKGLGTHATESWRMYCEEERVGSFLWGGPDSSDKKASGKSQWETIGVLVDNFWGDSRQAISCGPGNRSVVETRFLGEKEYQRPTRERKIRVVEGGRKGKRNA